MRLRGTTTSSASLYLATLRSACESSRRALHSRSRSPLWRAASTSSAPASVSALPHCSIMRSSAICGAVELDQQQRARAFVERQRGLLAHEVERVLVEQLEAARQDAGRSTAPTARPAAGRSGRSASRVATAFGLGQQLERDLGDHAERALAADEQRGQVVAGDALDRALAEPQQLAARGHELEPST